MYNGNKMSVLEKQTNMKIKYFSIRDKIAFDHVPCNGLKCKITFIFSVDTHKELKVLNMETFFDMKIK